MEGPNFEFYVVNYNFNKGTCEMFNIFRNTHVYEWCLKDVKKHLRNKKKFSFDELCESIRKTIMWKEWSRYEYECSVGPAFPKGLEDLRKIDCYWQALPNVRLIAEMLIMRYKEWKKNG